jgi:integrase
VTVSKTANGRWRARVKSGRDVIASQTFDTKGAADDWHKKQKLALVLGEYVDPRAGKESLGSAMERWMLSREFTVASSTFRADTNRLRYIPASLQKRPMSAVRSAEIQTLLDELVKSGLSPQTVARVRSLLGAFLGWARRESIISGDPLRGTTVPKGLAQGEHDEVFPFTLTELREVATEAMERSQRQGELALVLGLTGVRWGELAALRVRDVVSVPFPALRVTRSAPDGHEIRNRTKGGRARTVPLTAELVPVVADWASGKAPDDLLFTTDEGHRLNNSNWRRITGWATICRGRRIHDLRHTAATLWLSNGVDVKTCQQWLGHASAQLTLGLYGHWMGTDADAAAIARLNSAFSGDARGTRTAKLRTAD